MPNRDRTQLILTNSLDSYPAEGEKYSVHGAKYAVQANLLAPVLFQAIVSQLAPMDSR